jgi:small subunit ribosomal protein S5
VRAVLEAAGVQDVLTKTLGSNNPHNVLKATLDALRRIRKLQDLQGIRRKGLQEAEEAVLVKQEA